MPLNKIAFFGLFGQDNIGNDCTFEAILHNTKRMVPEAQLLCFCTGPETISARHRVPCFPIRPETKRTPSNSSIIIKLFRKIIIGLPCHFFHFIKCIRLLKNCDLFIIPGTGLLVDHTTGPFGFPFWVLKWSIMAKFCSCKLLYVSIGAGPIYKKTSRLFIKYALSIADYRSFRDHFSKNYLMTIGCNTVDDPIVPDLAFSLPGFNNRPINVDARPAETIGIGLLDYKGQHNKEVLKQSGDAAIVYDNYIANTAKLIACLAQKQFSIRVLIGDVKYDQEAIQNLIKVLTARDFFETAPSFKNEPIENLDDLLYEISRSDIVISPRFHNVILSLMMQKPVIAISYNEKFDCLMESFNLSSYCVNINSIDVEHCGLLVSDIRTNLKKLTSQINQQLTAHKSLLDEQYKVIFNSSINNL